MSGTDINGKCYSFNNLHISHIIIIVLIIITIPLPWNTSPPPVTDAGSGRPGAGRGRGRRRGRTGVTPHAAVACAGSAVSDSPAAPSASVGGCCDWLGTYECLLPRCHSPHPRLRRLHMIMHSAEEKNGHNNNTGSTFCVRG